MHFKLENGLGSDLLTRVVLIRHGQSTYNAEGKCQGRCDQPVLTEKGRSSVRQTGVALRGLNFDAVYTSPLRRAQESAGEILEAMSIAGHGAQNHYLPIPQVTDHLQEIDLPAWQGLTHKYIRQQLADEYRCWKERPHQFRMDPPQAEELAQTGGLAVASPVKQHFPVLDLYKQAQQFWQTILPRHADKTVLVVGHAGTHRALISTAMGLTPERYHILQQSNCGISILNFPNGWSQGAQLEVLNFTTHLGEILPKLKEGKQGLRLLLVRSGSATLQQIQIAEFLKQVPLDFCITSNLANAQETAELILQSRERSTVHLQVLKEDFPQVWQRAIAIRRAMAKFAGIDPTRPTTGLVVVHDAITKSMLGQVLGMQSDQLWRLKVDPGALSVIHYPSAASPPVLQAMNISNSALLSITNTGERCQKFSGKV